MKTIAFTAENGLCCGCGVCKSVCPKACILWERRNGLYLPRVDENRCVGCGLCAAVCPGLGHSYEPKGKAEETVTGTVLACYNAWSKDPELRHVSASGGVVSTMIRALLASGAYDGAFCLDSYDYRSQLKTRLYTADEVSDCLHTSNVPKSRYLPVSHENALAYMQENRDSRLIIVGTSCAVRGLQAAIKKLKLNRECYLFVGLFCDKVFNYNVLPFFENTYAHGETVRALHFKNKESGGWPGDMKFFPADGEPFYVPLSNRAKAKAYFMPERCLYCVDKLNACADLSVGDNYTGKDDSALGSNSVIIRTQKGAEAWRKAEEELEFREIPVEEIQKAQAVDLRLDNLYFGDLKTVRMQLDLNFGVEREKNCSDFTVQRKRSLQKLNSGAIYDVDPEQIAKQICRENRKPNPIKRLLKRGIRLVKRMLAR